MSADDLVDLHRRGMTDLFDKHCPVVQVRRRTKSTARWFDADCLAARRSARAAECTGGRVPTSTEATAYKVKDNAFGLRKEKRRILAERDHSE